MRKKRKIWAPEERAAWEARGEEIQRDLRQHIERIKLELAASKRKTA